MKLMLITNASKKSFLSTETFKSFADEVSCLSDLISAKEMGMATNSAYDAIVYCAQALQIAEAEKLAAYANQLNAAAIIFTEEADKNLIHNATALGIDGYVVGDVEAERMPSIIEAACARFAVRNKLLANLDDVTTKLNERKNIERAKGLLMKQRNLDEDEAFALMRTIAMRKNMKLADLAEQLLNTASLLTL